MTRLWHSQSRNSGQRALARLLCCACAPFITIYHAKASDSAGGAIVNTASISFDQGDSPVRVTATSNTVSLRLEELINVTLAPVQPTVIAAAGASSHPVPFTVTNSGNGTQTFTLSGTADGNGKVTGIAADANGNGVYDAGTEPILPQGEIAMGGGRSTTIFVLVEDVLDSGDQTAVTATVKAKRGTGPAGTVLTGAGAGGIDAIIGSTGAQATASATLVSGVTPSLVKSQTLLWTNDGSNRPARDSIVLYTLEAHFPSVTRAVEIADPLPAGTDYVAGSLTLDDAPLSDTADADQGAFVNQAVRVALGTVPAGQTHKIQFKVKIQ